MDRDDYLNLAGMAGLAVSYLLPDSVVKDVVRWSALSVILLHFVIMARSGYARRRPHWSRQSWRRFLMVCLIPVGALVMLAVMMALLEVRHPIAGASRSSARGLWAAGMLMFMMLGTCGLVGAVAWLAHGDPTRQLTWPNWRERLIFRPPPYNP